MKRKEKKRKFHDALLQMLYPPAPAPPQREASPEPPSLSTLELNLSNLPDGLDEEGGSPSSSSGGEEVESDGSKKKLTRAQRKRLRKKKLKEAASHRRKIIGPMMPPTEPGVCVVEDQPEGVRRNSPETLLDAEIQKPDSGQGGYLHHARSNQ